MVFTSFLNIKRAQGLHHRVRKAPALVPAAKPLLTYPPTGPLKLRRAKSKLTSEGTLVPNHVGLKDYNHKFKLDPKTFVNTTKAFPETVPRRWGPICFAW